MVRFIYRYNFDRAEQKLLSANCSSSSWDQVLCEVDHDMAGKGTIFNKFKLTIWPGILEKMTWYSGHFQYSWISDTIKVPPSTKTWHIDGGPRRIAAQQKFRGHHFSLTMRQKNGGILKNCNWVYKFGYDFWGCEGDDWRSLYRHVWWKISAGVH